MTRATYISAVLFSAAVAAAAVADGLQTGRWSPRVGLEKDVANLASFPLTVTDWVGSDTPISDEDFARGGVAGALFRSYRNRKTDDSVGLLIVVGRGGPISAHTPDVCYRGSGYELLSEITPVAVPRAGQQPTKCQTIRLRPPVTRPGTELEVTWGWITADGVSASENPRMTYAKLDVLHKFYVIRDRRPVDVIGSNDPGLLFLADIIPHLEALVERATPPGR